MTFDEIKKNKEVNEFITKGNYNLGLLGYTDHSQIHSGLVAQTAAVILKKFGYTDEDIELARIAGYMHDIGNVINRTDHAQSGAVMAYRLLDNMGMEAGDIAQVITAIGNHDENTAYPVDAVTAALIIADKTDVRSSRVRNQDSTTFDQHDRVNFAVKESKVKVENKKRIVVKIKLDKKICSVMDYFEIFLDRMILCRKAAEKLCVEFCLVINKERVI